MRTIKVFYHDDPDGWWATSPDIPGYTGFGKSYEEVRDQMNEGLPWYAEEDDLCLAHIILSAEGKPSLTDVPKVTFALTGQPKPRFHARTEPAGQV
jgi:predicted RNase H-like HicB family nuclease